MFSFTLNFLRLPEGAVFCLKGGEKMVYQLHERDDRDLSSEEGKQERREAVAELEKLLLEAMGSENFFGGLRGLMAIAGGLDLFSELPLKVDGREGENAKVTLIVRGEPLEVDFGRSYFNLRRETEKGIVSYRFHCPVDHVQLHLESGKPKLLFRIKTGEWLGVCNNDMSGKVNICFGPTQESLWLNL